MKPLRTFLALLCLGYAGLSHAVLTIEITQGVEGALPIAIVPFGWEGPQIEAPEGLAEIIAADLKRSGRFSPLPERDMLARPHEGSEVNFRDWRLMGVENLVVGRLRATDSGYVVQFQLFDVFRNTQMTGYSIRTDRAHLRRTAHQISDMLYETILGQPGAFATRIAYVTEILDAAAKKRYSLMVADADGFNEQAILNSEHPLMSPAWSPDGSRLAYVSFETGFPSIYIQEVASGRRELISYFQGLNGAPAWSPDGRRLALVLSMSGNPEIYILELANKKLTRLTHNYAIDTEPVWSPDGAALVFTSDRGGKPQLYRLNLQNNKVERLTYEGSYNARAAYAPDGKSLAFVHGDGGVYRIAVLELATGALQVLTESRLDESPSFAPNGSMIIYATESGGRALLAAVSIDGRVRTRLMLKEGQAREPSWSPFVH